MSDDDNSKNNAFDAAVLSASVVVIQEHNAREKEKTRLENVRASWYKWFLAVYSAVLMAGTIYFVCSYGGRAMANIRDIQQYIQSGCRQISDFILRSQRQVMDPRLCNSINIFGPYDPLSFLLSKGCRTAQAMVREIPADVPGLAADAFLFLGQVSELIGAAICIIVALVFSAPVLYRLRKPTSLRSVVVWACSITLGIVIYGVVCLALRHTVYEIAPPPQTQTINSTTSWTPQLPPQLIIIQNTSTDVVRVDHPIRRFPTISSIRSNSTTPQKSTAAEKRQLRLWDQAWYCSRTFMFQGLIQYYSEASDVYDYSALGLYGTYCNIQWMRWYYDDPTYLSSAFDYVRHIPAVHSIVRWKKTTGGTWKMIKGLGGSIRNLLQNSPQTIESAWNWLKTVWVLLKEAYSQSSTQPLFNAVQQSTTLSWPLKWLLSFIVA